ncbi:MAG: hypothetical protein ACLFPQ_00980 [Candidatus Woesearchaeota archaeon]
MERKKINKSKYAAVFLLTTLIFLSGLYLGNTILGKKLQQVDSFAEQIKTDTLALEVQYLLFQEDPCKYINTTPLTDELYQLALRLDYMENRMEKENPDVLRMKEYYYLLELRHWLFLKKTRDQCGTNDIFILYFYGDEKACSQCEEQGFILTWLRTNYPSVKVYSFDITSDNIAVETVKKFYGVSQPPTIIIDNDTIEGFITKNELKDIIENSSISEPANEINISEEIINVSLYE